jgi:hypothetical protein
VREASSSPSLSFLLLPSDHTPSQVVFPSQGHLARRHGPPWLVHLRICLLQVCFLVDVDCPSPLRCLSSRPLRSIVWSWIWGPWAKALPDFHRHRGVRGCSSPRWGRCFVVATKSICFCQVKTWSALPGWTGDGGVFSVVSFLQDLHIFPLAGPLVRQFVQVSIVFFLSLQVISRLRSLWCVVWFFFFLLLLCLSF